MQKLLTILTVLLVTHLAACDIGVFVFKARAVMKDHSVLTGYFMQDGHESPMNLADTPLNEPDCYSVKDGTDILPALTPAAKGDWWYVPDYVKLPWGYYYNTATGKTVSFADADSLIYLSEHLPMEIKRLAPWHGITPRQIELVRQGICGFDHILNPLSTYIYISTRDSLSNDEIELYSLEGNVMGETEKDSYHRSFFFHTPENKSVLEGLYEDYPGFQANEFTTILTALKYNRAKLALLPYLIDRNILMQPQFQTSLKQEVHTALDHMDLAIKYYELRRDHPRNLSSIFKLYDQIDRLCPAADKDSLASTDRFWKSLSTILFPRLTNYFNTDLNFELVDAILADIGIVRVECWYESDGF